MPGYDVVEAAAVDAGELFADAELVFP